MFTHVVPAVGSAVCSGHANFPDGHVEHDEAPEGSYESEFRDDGLGALTSDIREFIRAVVAHLAAAREAI